MRNTFSLFSSSWGKNLHIREKKSPLIKARGGERNSTDKTRDYFLRGILWEFGGAQKRGGREIPHKGFLSFLEVSFSIG